MNPEFVSRYIRPADILLLDESILTPILSYVAEKMIQSHPDLSTAQWMEAIREALIRGELAIVIDDERKRLGIVSTANPPYASLLHNTSLATEANLDIENDPLGIKGLSPGPDFPADPQDRG